MRRHLLSLAAAGVVMSGGIAAVPLTALAQGPIVTGGLVNVTISNVLNNNAVTVTIPIQAAANICGTSVTVLSTLLAPGGPVSCTSNPSQGVSVSVSPR